MTTRTQIIEGLKAAKYEHYSECSEGITQNSDSRVTACDCGAAKLNAAIVELEKGAVQAEPGSYKHLRLERVCPRCRFHGYHWAVNNCIAIKITCTDCGHDWKGRFIKDEWE